MGSSQFWTFRVNGIMRHVVSRVASLLSLMSPWSHLWQQVSWLPPSVAGQCSIIQTDCILLIRSLWADSAVVSTLGAWSVMAREHRAHMFVWTCLSFSWVCTYRGGTARSHGSSASHVLRNCQTVLPSGHTILHSL